jgi:hypothetical protein
MRVANSVASTPSGQRRAARTSTGMKDTWGGGGVQVRRSGRARRSEEATTRSPGRRPKPVVRTADSTAP